MATGGELNSALHLGSGPSAEYSMEPSESVKDPHAAFMDVVEKVQGRDDMDKYAKKVYWCLDKQNPVRRMCIAMMEWPWFDRSIMILILINSIMMAVFAKPIELHQLAELDEQLNATWGCGPGQYWDSVKDYEHRSQYVESKFELVFLVLFTLEMLVKLTAMGLIFERRSYLRNGWNWLDMVVVITGFVELGSSGAGGAVQVLRLFRLLRPLRALNRVRGMRVLVNCILQAMPQMCRVFMVLCLLVLVLAIVGVQLFKSKLRTQCFYETEDGWQSTGYICDPQCDWDEDRQQLMRGTNCSSFGVNTKQQRNAHAPWTWTCDKGQQCLCGETASDDPYCTWLDNPNYGVNSFDNILSAMMTIFQSITLEGWVDVMYFLQDGVSPISATIYQVLLVLLGALIVMNLFLAVLADNFAMADADPDDPEEPPEEDGEVVLAEAARKIDHANPIRRFCHSVIMDRRFENFILGCILANTIFMCIVFFPPRPDKYGDDLDGTQYMPPAFYWFLFGANAVLTFIFTAETVMKLLGLGPRVFIKDSFNIFDFFVVSVSLVEIILEILGQTGTADTSGVPALSVLRALRVFRVFKMIRSVASLRAIIASLVRSLKSVVYLSALLILFIFIFALLGMEFFGGFTPYPVNPTNFTQGNFPCAWKQYNIIWPDDELPPRANFDYIGYAFLSIFIVLSGENWNEIYFAQHRATWEHYGPTATIYFVLLFVLGNLILFNLFIAILISNMEGEEEDETPSPHGDSAAAEAVQQRVFEYQFGHYVDRASNGEALLAPSTPVDSSMSRKLNKHLDAAGSQSSHSLMRKKRQSVHTLVEVEGSSDKSLCLFSWNNPVRRGCARLVWHPHFDRVVFVLILISSLLLGIDWPGWDSDATIKQVLGGFDILFTVLFTIEMMLKIIVYGFIYSKDKRHPAYLRVGWNVLDFVVVLISIFSLISREVDSLNKLPTASLRAVRALRALRPLRLIARMENMRVVVSTLLGAIPAVGIFALVLLLFVIIFAILFMQTFGGKLGYCLDPLYSDSVYESRVVPGYNNELEQNDYEECMALPRYNLTRYNTAGVELTDPRFADPNDRYYNGEDGYNMYTEFPQWVNPDFGHFDNVATSVLLLLEVACLEGWPDVMYRVMDTDLKRNYINPYWLSTEQDPNGLYGQEHLPNTYFGAFFFVVWIVLGCFVLLNMVIGVVLDSFNQIKQENDGLTMMTEEQGEWVKAQKAIMASRPLKQATPPKEPWRMPAFTLVTSNGFDLAIMSIIVLNMFFMCITTWDPSPFNDDIKVLAEITNVSNLIFFVFYVVEMILKFVGLGFRQYFKDMWNQFDFLLVLLSALDIAFSSNSVTLPIPPALLRVVRMFRVVRILRILKTAKHLRTIITTIRISIPGLYNISILLFIVMYIYAVICMNLFWQINYTPGDISPFGGASSPWHLGEAFYYSNDNSNEGDFVNRNANFRTLPNSLLTLFRCATGESFNGIMHDMMAGAWGSNRLRCCPTCGAEIDGELNDSCGPAEGFWSLLLMLSYTIIMGFIILNGLFIGVIVDNFTNIGSENKAITVESIEEFREVWLMFDPKGTFTIPSHSLLVILQKLQPPLGIADVKPPLSRAEMLQLLGKLDIPDHGGQIHFLETLTALSHNVCGVPVPVCDTTRRLQRSVQKIPVLSKLEKPQHNALTNYLVSLLQSRWRGYAMRKQYADHVGESYINDEELPSPHQLRTDPHGTSGSDVADTRQAKNNRVSPAPPANGLGGGGDAS